MIWLLYFIIPGLLFFGFYRLSHIQQNPSWRPKPRWQPRYASLVKQFDSRQIEDFYTAICQLAVGYPPPAARSIYFQAHQFTAKYSAGYSLLLYLQYLHVKTSSANFPHRKISAELKKILFRTKMQETTFLQICARLKETHNLNQAIDDTKVLSRLKRKEINLDMPAIEEVSREHSQTAELLGKYLEDDNETIPETPISAPVSPINRYEKALFRLFEENNFVLDKKEMNIFAQKNGVFRDSLIQQINETYYETLDDLLIEEASDEYTINETYYKQITQCP